MRGTSESPEANDNDRVLTCLLARTVFRTRVALLIFSKSYRVNSMGTLVDKIDFTLYAKPLSSAANHVTHPYRDDT